MLLFRSAASSFVHLAFLQPFLLAYGGSDWHRLAHRVRQVLERRLQHLLARVRVEVRGDDVRQRVRQQVRDVNGLDSQIDQELRGTGIGDLDVRVEVHEEVDGVAIVVRVGVLHIERHDRHAVLDGRVELHYYPWARQDAFGLE